MSINSHAFGRVVLTGTDAKKFEAQIKYGRPKVAAKNNVLEGVKISAGLQHGNSIKVRLKELA